MIQITLLNIAIFQGVVISAILLHSPFFKSKANRYFAFAIFSISWSLLNFVMSPIYDDYPFLKVIDILDSAVLFPVLILFFVMHQIGHPQKRIKKLRWLFLPFLFFVAQSMVDELSLESQQFEHLSFMKTIDIILENARFLIALLFIPFVLIKTHQFIQHSKRKQEKKWLTYLWSFEVIFLGCWLLLISLISFIEFDFLNIMKIMSILALFVSLMIHWIAYSGVYKLKLVNDQEKISMLLSNRAHQTQLHLSKEEVFETGKKPLSKENVYYEKLEKLCSYQKIYRDSSLDRNTVADMLSISPSYVSQIINSITGDNFSTYINRYRVEDVKILILDKEFDNYSLLAIGLECGFSSKTTFYNAFKKFTGVTPNAYRKANQ